MTETWLADAAAWVGDNPGWLILALFATAMVESIAIAGLIVPGVAMLFGFAALAGKSGMPLSEALLWAGLGAVIGDAISFAIGRYVKGRLHSVWPFTRYPGLVTRGETFFNAHGGKSVIAGRFIGPIRPVIPLIAGALHMSWRRFLSFNLISAVGWALVYVLPGYAIGSALASEIEPPPHFYPVIAVSAAILVVLYVVVLQFRLGVGEGSRPYRWLESRMTRYDTTHRFWRLYTNERPSRKGEFPLPSIVMAAAALAMLLILTQVVNFSRRTYEFNQLVSSWFDALRQPLLDIPAAAATLLGDPPVLLSAALMATLVLAFRGYYAAALHIAGAALLSLVSVWLLKTGLPFEGPSPLLKPPTSGTFPSAQATGATVLVTMAASFIAGESRKKQRWQTYVLLSLPLIPIGLSQLYLGTNWFTDVLGGFLLGLVITGAIRASYSRYDRVPIWADACTWVAVALWLAFSAGYLAMQWNTASVACRPLF
ncbi:VTT domain-containing protein [Marinobacter sp.]|uniref:VTT domain-containing protein n=1 Tax=Marinobacter sp. TaxID=50741 RepID=UPI001A0E3157|nr:VTT domain-containing protein [Marinobacter sp.]MBE0484952.1 bifunctional DedA family/phosphatase PAP2 family protein [Marinobacter sp.]